LSGAVLRRLKALGEDGGLLLRLAFFATHTPSDSSAVERAAGDLGLQVPYVIVGEEDYGAMAAPLGLRAPWFLLARRGMGLLVVSNRDPLHALSVIEAEARRVRRGGFDVPGN
jgi:hypothetical protein